MAALLLSASLSLLLPCLSFRTFPDFPVVGVNTHYAGEGLEGETAMLSHAFGITRTDLRWGAVETERGVYNFSDTDAHIAEHEREGVKIWFILDGSNALYCNDGAAPVGKEQVDAFVSFAVAAMARYSARVMVWELWNEPNLVGWAPFPNANDYAVLAKALGLAKAARSPNSTLVGPGLFTVDKPFVSKLVAAGVLDAFDAWSFHPYRWGGVSLALQGYLFEYELEITPFFLTLCPSVPLLLLLHVWDLRTD
jgi:hypothetical protein